MQVGLLGGSGQRQTDFNQALKSRGHPDLRCLSFADYLIASKKLDSLISEVDILRVDTPGGGFDIWSAFSSYLGRSTRGFTDHHGQIYPQSIYFDGTNSIVDAALSAASTQGKYCTIDAQAVRTFIDKAATHALCSDASLPVPEALPGIINCQSLELAMKDRNLRRVFMKLRYGSSASGVLAIDRQGHRIRAHTTVEHESQSGKLFNSLKMRTYLDQSARDLIDRIAGMGVHVEAWVPKLRIAGQPCDIRLLVINGRPAHCVVRSADSPITNLHLGNRRHNPAVLREHITSTLWDEILDTALLAGRLFPAHFCIGLDIAIHQNRSEFFVLEINAFGDHLHGVFHDGLSPYEYQIQEWESRFA